MVSVSKARRARCPDVHRQIRRIHRKVYNAGRDQQSMVFVDRSRFLTPNSLVDKKNTHSPVNNGGGAALVANDALEGSGQVVVQTSRLQRGNEAGEASSDSSAIRPSWPGRRLMTCSRRQEGRGRVLERGLRFPDESRERRRSSREPRGPAVRNSTTAWLTVCEPLRLTPK